MRSGVKWTLVAVAGMVAAALLVVGGLLMGMNLGGYALQREVLEKLGSSYYKKVDARALEDGAVIGMLTGLNDPYTFYMSPEDYAVYLERMSGFYSGVGMVVEMSGGLVTIVSTFDDSPRSAGRNPVGGYRRSGGRGLHQRTQSGRSGRADKGSRGDFGGLRDVPSRSYDHHDYRGK